MKGCRCRVCLGERPPSERRKWRCRYVDVRSDVIRLRMIYQTYIENNRAPLLDFPYWMAEVAEAVDMAEAKRDLKQGERDRSMDILEAEGIPTPRKTPKTIR